MPKTDAGKKAVEKLIATAKAEVGYLEKASEKDLYDKKANPGHNDYTKYGYEMHKVYPQTMDYPAYWCDCFVDWCFYKTFGVANAAKLLGGRFDDYTINSSGLYKAKNAYHKTNPEPGDQIFFNNGVRICHTGIVYNVDATYVYTIEGNTSASAGVIRNGEGVAFKKYARSYRYIDGYGRPDYDMLATRTPSTTPIPAPKTESTAKPAPKKSTEKLECPKPVLNQNSKDVTEIIKLQKALNKILGTKLSIDGSFGPTTLKALKDFQSKHKLTVDGSYGPASEKVMKSLL